ncbi:Tyrosine-specific transport protein 1 [Candidatus Protochlamydia amoebophila]|uniref:Tyrosine-specific transport protein 1 n=1 Tax=Candidatus Protochlamydia amoebophila TaxID=362787 RepID=A0A0C1H036_9BACT|nr:Tyrosine-specific transport protein 1 [Candidatus Protochlamydia amoebophila]
MWTAVCWVVYLFIGYASLVAYTSGAGKEVSFVLTKILHIPFSSALGSLIFLVAFGGVIFLGYHMVERVNSIPFISMIAAYLLMISLAPKEINLHLLERQNWNVSHLFCIVPLMLTTFSFPGIVPTIVPYLNRNVRAIRIAIIGGTSLTFIVYCIWLLIIFGTVPNEGIHGLQEALICDIPATECLHYVIKNPLLSYVAQFFAFFCSRYFFFGYCFSAF